MSTATEPEERAELHLKDIAEALQSDWVSLAKHLGVKSDDINKLQSDYESVSEQSLVMLHNWVQIRGDEATGNDLEKALKEIGREDVISKCMSNTKEVVQEKPTVKEYLDSSTLDFVHSLFRMKQNKILLIY